MEQLSGIYRPTRAPRLLAVLCLIAATAVACTDTKTEEIAGPSGVRCPVVISSPSPVPPAAHAFTLSLTTGRECTWSIEVDGNWLTVEPNSGQGNATLSVTTVENPQGRPRVASVAINNQKVAITQQPAPCQFAVVPRTVAMRAQGGRATVQLSTLDGCSWSAQTSHPWVRIVSGSGGESSRVIELAVDSNPGGDRSTELRVAGIPVTIAQDSISDGERGCPYSIAVGGANFSAAGGTGSVRLHTLPGCAWGPVSDQSWLVIVSNHNLIGTDDIHYRVDPNTSSRSRTGTISAGGRRHIVNQARN